MPGFRFSERGDRYVAGNAAPAAGVADPSRRGRAQHLGEGIRLLH